MSEIKTAAKHVVISGGRLSDGGSIPPASTKFLRRKNLVLRAQSRGQLDQRVEVRLAHINSRSLMALRLSQGRQTTGKVVVAGSPDAGNTL